MIVGSHKVFLVWTNIKDLDFVVQQGICCMKKKSTEQML